MNRMMETRKFIGDMLKETGTILPDEVLKEVEEFERLVEIGEALELFETSELDYDGVVDNVKGLLAWYRNEVSNEV